MSDSYFPNQYDGTGTQQVNGFPPEPHQVGYDAGLAPGEQRPPGPPPTRQPYGYPTPPHEGRDSGSGHRTRPPTHVMVAIAALTMLTLGLTGLAVMNHSKLGDAETKTASLSKSLEQANTSLGDTTAELKSNKEKLTTAEESLGAAGAALGVAIECATQLQAAWTAFLQEDVESAKTALAASEEPCAQLPDGSGSDTE